MQQTICKSMTTILQTSINVQSMNSMDSFTNILNIRTKNEVLDCTDFVGMVFEDQSTVCSTIVWTVYKFWPNSPGPTTKVVLQEEPSIT